MKNPVFTLNSEDNFLKVFEESKRYLNDQKELAKEIDEYICVINELQSLIPETIEKFWSGHIFPYTECQYEIEASFHFCLLGFYKHAFISLRNALELGLISVYWDIEDKSEVDIQLWLKSFEDTPFKREIAKRLLKNENIVTFDKTVNFIEQVNDIYKTLSNYGHTKGARFSSRGLSISNINSFHEKSVLLWFKYFKQVVQMIITIHICKYPVGFQHTPIDEKFGLNGPIGGFLNPHEAERMRQILPKNWVTVLQKISDNDQSALSTAEWVSKHPDITQKEFNEQIKESDKDMIRHNFGGFKHWLKNEEKILESLKGKPNEYHRHKEYIEEMTKWAHKEGLIKD